MQEHDWLHDAWEHREDVLYPSVLGRADMGTIHTLNEDVFLNRFEQTSVDPRWLHCGVLTFPSAGSRPSCALVTSGLSNAWEATGPAVGGLSGLGFELQLELRDCYAWARTILLRLLAHQLLVHAGLMEGDRLFDGALMPLGGSIIAGSELTHLLTVRSPDAPHPLELVTGTFELLLLIGITDLEAHYAQRESAGDLVARLRDQIDWSVTDPSRRSVRGIG